MISEHVVASDNIVFTLAEEFVRKTSRSIFLTGKAGTGKTTFLRHIRDITTKATVIVAPTGVAAINAGGTTIHSFFQLPFSPFIPVEIRGFEQSADMSDKYALLKNLRVESEKRNILRGLELLIIDEVSMVRCDILDAIDTILRHFRRKPFTPFGGVQVLLIGDLFQLPPVVPDGDWEILKRYYGGPFFFHSKVMQQSPPLYLELKKIYRQTDERFISILNNIRDNTIEEDDLIKLNERYIPRFVSGEHEHYIILTTHNHKADAINANRLSGLDASLFRFEGEIEGEFPERMFPTDRILNLKEGAQVMFLRNDAEKVRRYYNGKIGTIKRIAEDKIVVHFPNEMNEIELEKEIWHNIRYAVNSESGQLEEEIVGTFRQYAIRLAWAVTIHKSQGLTFDRVVIDAVDSFAPGQVYVALSRCTSLQGIVLCSRIFRHNVMTDERVIRFAEEESSPEELEPVLQQDSRQFYLNKLSDLFDLTFIADEIESFQKGLQKRKLSSKKLAEEAIEGLTRSANEQLQISRRFQEQLKRLVDGASTPSDHEFINERVESAARYFISQLEDTFLNPLIDHQKQMKGKPGVKGYGKAVKSLITFFNDQKSRFEKAGEMAKKLATPDSQ
jgi:ATP-dependent exoDNAse (exonuclease V) alpha subunit